MAFHQKALSLQWTAAMAATAEGVSKKVDNVYVEKMAQNKHKGFNLVVDSPNLFWRLVRNIIKAYGPGQNEDVIDRLYVLLKNVTYRDYVYCFTEAVQSFAWLTPYLVSRLFLYSILKNGTRSEIAKYLINEFNTNNRFELYNRSSFVLEASVNVVRRGCFDDSSAEDMIKSLEDIRSLDNSSSMSASALPASALTELVLSSQNVLTMQKLREHFDFDLVYQDLHDLIIRAIEGYASPSVIGALLDEFQIDLRYDSDFEDIISETIDFAQNSHRRYKIIKLFIDRGAVVHKHMDVSGLYYGGKWDSKSMKAIDDAV